MMGCEAIGPTPVDGLDVEVDSKRCKKARCHHVEAGQERDLDQFARRKSVACVLTNPLNFDRLENA
jgi:hypothetical protein